MPFNLFGKREKAPTTEEAINKLRETEEMLGKKSEHIEKQICSERDQAKKLGTKNKRQAIGHLKKAKRFEQQLAQVDNTLSTIEFQREALSNAKANADVLKTMQSGAQAMQHIHKTQDIDKVEDVMADIQEQQDIANEIADAISRPIDQGNEIDDDELFAELEEMEQEAVDDMMISGGAAATSMPSVPLATHVPSATPQQTVQQPVEDDDLADLENWVAS